MSTKVKAMMLVTIMIVSLSVTAIIYILSDPCEECGNKFCFGDCTIRYEDDPNVSSTIKQQQFKTNQSGTRLAETKKASRDYLDSLVFIGDSRTVALQLHAELNEENVFAEEGLNHEEALTKQFVKIQDYKKVTIADAVKVAAPDVMIVNFGINGISWMSVDTFIEGYEQLIDTLIEASPSSIIVIEAIMPVSLSYEQRSDGVTNEKIDEANDALFKMAKEKGLYYLGTDEVMKNDMNDLMDGFSGDGLHYTKAAYEVIIDYILSHAIYKNK